MNGFRTLNGKKRLALSAAAAAIFSVMMFLVCSETSNPSYKDGHNHTGGRIDNGGTVTPPTAYFRLDRGPDQEGTGTVSCTPNDEAFAQGTYVVCRASSADGYTFSQWAGSAMTDNPTVTVQMDGDKRLIAIFSQQTSSVYYTLSVYPSTEEGGTVEIAAEAPSYLEGSNVTIKAAAKEGWNFDGWFDESGNPAGENQTSHETTVYMNGNKTITAHFSKIPDDVVVIHRLNLSHSPSEGGSVSADPPGPEYAQGNSVRLTASPNGGWRFERWSGDETSTEHTVRITMNAPKTVTAIFVRETVEPPAMHILNTNVTGGSGSISRAPNAPSYAHGTQVTLTAQPSSGFEFVQWSGGAAGTTMSVTVTMDAPKTVTAEFRQIPSNTFPLNTSVTGSGSITRSPNATNYAAGTEVTLTAVPSPGWEFRQWSGGAAGTTNPIAVTVNAAMTVTAVFELASVILLDDFEDGDNLNKFGYKWRYSISDKYDKLITQNYQTVITNAAQGDGNDYYGRYWDGISFAGPVSSGSVSGNAAQGSYAAAMHYDNWIDIIENAGYTIDDMDNFPAYPTVSMGTELTGRPDIGYGSDFNSVRSISFDMWASNGVNVTFRVETTENFVNGPYGCGELWREDVCNPFNSYRVVLTGTGGWVNHRISIQPINNWPSSNIGIDIKERNQTGWSNWGAAGQLEQEPWWGKAFNFNRANVTGLLWEIKADHNIDKFDGKVIENAKRGTLAIDNIKFHRD